MGVAAMQIGRICTIPDLARPDCASVQIGGYRAKAVTSNRHVARLVFQGVSEPSADYFLLPLGLMQAAGERM
jgi:hypothetical protein